MTDKVRESLFAMYNTIYDATDSCLNDWLAKRAGNSCLQFPTLLVMVGNKLSCTDKELRQVDPIMRQYIKNHDEWYVTRGAKGGIMPISDKKKKDDVKASKVAVKKQLEKEIAEKIAKLDVLDITPVTEPEQPSLSEDSEETDPVDFLDSIED